MLKKITQNIADNLLKFVIAMAIILALVSITNAVWDESKPYHEPLYTNTIQSKNSGGDITLETSSGSEIATFYNNKNAKIVGKLGVGTNPQNMLDVNGRSYLRQNVGIGTVPSDNPLIKLDVGGFIRTKGGDETGLRMLNTESNVYYGVGVWDDRLEWYEYNGTYHWALLTSRGGKWEFGGYADPNGPRLQVAGSTHISGSLGVGTANPQNKLDVNGRSYLRDHVGIGTPPTSSYKLNVSGKANADKLCIAGDCKSAWPEAGQSLWQQQQSGNGIYYNGGNVGIGTSNPQNKLDVNGDIHANNLNATRFYDSDSRQYYIDPAYSSKMKKLVIGNFLSWGLYLHDNQIDLGDGSYDHIDITQKLGVKTDNPQADLDVAGDIRSSGSIRTSKYKFLNSPSSIESDGNGNIIINLGGGTPQQ